MKRLLSTSVIVVIGLCLWGPAGCGDSSSDTPNPGQGGQDPGTGGSSAGNGGSQDQGGAGGSGGKPAGGSAGVAGKAGSTAGAAGAPAGAAGQPAGAAGAPAGAGGGPAGAAGGPAGAAGAAGSSLVVPCNGTPSSCAGIAADQDAQLYGCCDGDTVYWCDDQGGSWSLKEADCAGEGQICGYADEYQGLYCIEQPCTPTSCTGGKVCLNGHCVTDPGPGPGPGPGPTCNALPPVQCTGSASECGELVPFEPVQGVGYDNYPLNGETASNQYRSYLRRDLMMLIKYACAYVDCKAKTWTPGNGGLLGLGDMSEANGAIPGTSINDPGHPAGTHTNGFDIDVAYWQINTPDNKLRPICEHTQNGKEVYHCTAPPYLLDVWRHALWLGALHEHPYLRVVGVDGQAGLILEPAINKLCQDGWLSTKACSSSKLAYEVTNQGSGWFQFHHHHSHVSLSKPSYPFPGSEHHACLIPSCDKESLNEFLSRYGL